MCHRCTSAQRSRHIERKLYKMRELRGAGLVTVKYLETAENTADLIHHKGAKVLQRQPFERKAPAEGRSRKTFPAHPLGPRAHAPCLCLDSVRVGGQ